MTRRAHHPGFTLIELVVAIVLIAGVAGATTFSLAQSLRALDGSRASREAMDRAQSAAESVARQVERCVRDGDLYFARVLLTDREGVSGPADELLVFINDERPIRPWENTAEACDREVQFRLSAQIAPGVVAQDESLRPDPDEPGQVLWRRTDLALDDQPAGGGVIEPVARGVIAMSITAFDGNRWSAAWDSDRDGIPYAIEVSVIATDEKDTKRAVARRTVAIDRAPLPYVKLRVEEDGEGGDR